MRNKPASRTVIKCSLCKIKFMGTTAKADCKSHLRYCERKCMVMENDKKFGIAWKNISTNDFKCMHCSGNQPPYGPKNCRPYTTNLREHAFRHVYRMHANQIPSDAVKIDIKRKAPKRRASEADQNKSTSVKADSDITANETNVVVLADSVPVPAEVEILKGK